MNAASLLATVDSGVTFPKGIGADTHYLQYFATGDAATLLALQQDVRKAMLVRLDPNQDKYGSLFQAGRFEKDDYTDRLRTWLDADPGNENVLRDWMTEKGLHPRIMTSFLYTTEFATLRKAAVEDLCAQP